MKRNFAVIVGTKVVNVTAIDKNTVEESITFLNENFPIENGTWKHIDYSSPKHRHCAVNSNYNSDSDYYYDDKPSNNYVYDSTNYRWIPNVDYPDGEYDDLNHDNNTYYWDDQNQVWVEKT
jgi:hypothetical protein|tara:strand:+ start:68 stop:430 length:363 start_codon:yes stop_codon:yes gene_type:complete